jgi:hypothetical protein
MKDKVHATHGGLNAPRIPNIADIELQFRVVAAFPHVILLLSSRLKIRISAISVERKRRSTALPKEPVPPVIRRV